MSSTAITVTPLTIPPIIGPVCALLDERDDAAVGKGDGPVPVVDPTACDEVDVGFSVAPDDDPTTVLDCGDVRDIGGPSEQSQEPGLPWYAEPGDVSDSYPNRKTISTNRSGNSLSQSLVRWRIHC